MNNRQKSLLLGTKLRVHFENKGFTQKQLADAMKVKQSWISRIYRGEFSARSEIAKSMCTMAGLPFLDDAKFVEAADADLLGIAAKLAGFSEGERKAISKLSSIFN